MLAWAARRAAEGWKVARIAVENGAARSGHWARRINTTTTTTTTREQSRVQGLDVVAAAALLLLKKRRRAGET
ncbi:hypothetical protein CMUS01_14520 [Colletotrichum musicola]|uniref:Uncharacterized protein n=1 Tax=Colletotrichum musicola TaxID=2175873 RepID=A0A8H6J3F7_9PEZI|nr:hypothetical protein CMUS01_14520 [Colletotrichum musicola]